MPGRSELFTDMLALRSALKRVATTKSPREIAVESGISHDTVYRLLRDDDPTEIRRATHRLLATYLAEHGDLRRRAADAHGASDTAADGVPRRRASDQAPAALPSTGNATLDARAQQLVAAKVRIDRALADLLREARELVDHPVEDTVVAERRSPRRAPRLALAGA